MCPSAAVAAAAAAAARRGLSMAATYGLQIRKIVPQERQYVLRPTELVPIVPGGGRPSRQTHDDGEDRPDGKEATALRVTSLRSSGQRRVSVHGSKGAGAAAGAAAAAGGSSGGPATPGGGRGSGRLMRPRSSPTVRLTDELTPGHGARHPLSPLAPEWTTALGGGGELPQPLMAYRGAPVHLAPIADPADEGSTDPDGAGAEAQSGAGAWVARVAQVLRCAFGVRSAAQPEGVDPDPTQPPPGTGGGDAEEATAATAAAATASAATASAASTAAAATAAAFLSPSQRRSMSPDVEQGTQRGAHRVSNAGSNASSLALKADASIVNFFRAPTNRRSGDGGGRRGAFIPLDVVLLNQRRSAARAAAQLSAALSKLSQRMALDNPALAELLNLSNVYDMVALHHRSVLATFGCSIQSDRVVLVQEFCECGALEKMPFDRMGLGLPVLWGMARPPGTTCATCATTTHAWHCECDPPQSFFLLSLCSLLISHVPLFLSSRCPQAEDLCAGLNFLHEGRMPIVAYLREANVLVDSTLCPKVRTAHAIEWGERM